MRILFITIMLIMTTACSSKKISTYSNTFAYYDFYLNENFILNNEKKTIDGLEYVDSIEICDKSNKNICFNTQFFSFGMPKNLDLLQTWDIGKTKYCLIKRSYDRTNASISLIVNFGYEKTCEEIEKKPYKLVFNTKFGLRYMEGRNTNGYPIKIISLKEYGFGGKFVVKTR
ncbi:MAG: hypothetical protein JKY19_13060 [Alcanivoracaceae bacterium]|nr:hypothetical protein [Alcanivoracaceae bacterium]